MTPGEVYYNEFDPGAAAWLRELMSAGLIPQGHVDERSIADVRPSDLAGFVQCHFFAGIGGWAYALRLAGWPDADNPRWQGCGPDLPRRNDQQQPAEPSGGPWSDCIWLPCADGAARRVEPGTPPLVDGLPGRVGLLRGYGNAIVPQVAAEFIRAWEEASR